MTWLCVVGEGRGVFVPLGLLPVLRGACSPMFVGLVLMLGSSAPAPVLLMSLESSLKPRSWPEKAPTHLCSGFFSCLLP